ncbi:MAG: ABC transporter substrate-binding protein [Burkholderiales bacterium]
MRSARARTGRTATRIAPLLLVGLALLSATLRAQVPSYYPSAYRETIAAGRAERRVLVYSTTDYVLAAPLIRDFESLYPGIRVDYEEMHSAEVYRRFVAESAAGTPTADVLWNSAMDLQIKLANDRHAAAYKSPEIKNLPEWAVWRDEAFATTFEPAVFVYNKRLLGANEVPQTHADFVRVLRDHPDRLLGKVTTYDIAKAAVGFLFATQDSKTSPGFWNLARALGASQVRLEAVAESILQRIASGESLLGYNLIGSYAMAKAKLDPSLGVVLPRDYTLVMSRVMLIAKTAKHPNAARLWVDYVLSQRGQTVMATKATLFSIRNDVTGEFTAAALTKVLGPSLRPIDVGPGLLVYLDQAKRRDFLKRWEEATTPSR